VLTQVALAPVAGLVAATAGFEWAFALNTASFALSALALGGLEAEEEPLPVTSGTIWRQGIESLSLLASDPMLRALAVAQALAALSAGATSALLVPAADHLEVGGGVGAFVGPLLLTRLADRW